MRACPNCNQDNPDRAKFCLECGAPLADAAVPAREVRKTVTLVFCDLAESTALGERLDAEALRKTMSRYYEEMRTVVERHGGAVEKFIGDAVVGVFGVPAVHEDDALRAVRAAYEMQEAIRVLNKELERDRGVTIAVRTGVNTGEIMAGDSGSVHGLMASDTANVAARLEQAAAPGEILLAESCHHLVRDAVSVEPLEPLSLKGKAEPVAAVRLLAVNPDAAGHVRRLDAPMIGREREATLLTQAFDRAASDGACQLFTVLGSAGVGKSRLTEEFLAGVDAPARIVRGRCLPYGEGITFWPVAEAVADAAGLLDVDPPDVVATKIGAVLGDAPDAALIRERVTQILGMGEVAVPEETLWAIRKLFEAVAEAAPLVVVFDDLHWAEPTFLDLVEHISEWSRDSPILLLCMSRQELLDRRANWAGGKLNATTILLEPLGDDDATRLLDQLLGAAELPPSLRERILEAADGNPLFVEETLSMLIDDASLVSQDGRWVPSVDLSDIDVPPTIHALLAARLDLLGEPEREVLEHASVEGRDFSLAGLRALLSEGSREQARDRLQSLIRKELVRPLSRSFAGDETLAFRHILIRDAAYEGVPKERRAELHERYADWLAEVAADRLTEFQEIIGYHLEQAQGYLLELGPADERTLELGIRAAEQLAAAGLRSLGRGDSQGASALLRRALALWPEGHPDRIDPSISLSIALNEAGELEEQSTVLEQLERETRAAGNERGLALARLAHWLYTGAAGLWVTSEVKADTDHAIEVFERLGDEFGLAWAWDLRGWSVWIQYKAAEANDAWIRSHEHALLAGDRSRIIGTLEMLASPLKWGPTPVDQALVRCDELLEQARGHRPSEAGIIGARAILLAMAGRPEEARACAAAEKAVYQELGLRYQGAWLAQTPGFAELLLGNPAGAEAALRPGYDAAAEMGAQGPAQLLGAMLARATAQLGRDEEAEAYAAASWTDDTEDFSVRSLTMNARALVLARKGAFDEAEALSRQVVETIESTDFLHDRADAWMDLAEVLRLAGKPREAAESVRRALDLYERKGGVLGAERARALLGELA